MDPTIVLLAVLVAISAGALAYAFLFQQIEVEKKTTSRFKRVQAAETDHANIIAARDRVQELSKRRKSMQDSLRDMEKKQNEKAKKAKNVSLRDKLVQAGLAISVRQFHLLSAGAAGCAAFIALIYGLSLLIALLIAAVVALGLPRWVLAFLLKRRQKKFLEEFPNALDVMCRSIKSGLPLNDAVRLIASDGQEPVKTEFQRVVDAQQVGIGIPQGIERMMLTMPLFEVKASAVIIGALPFIVMLLVHLTSPDYLSVLFTDVRGHMILGASGLWMLIGIFIMRQMINFDI
jgi:tight adherence protein B